MNVLVYGGRGVSAESLQHTLFSLKKSLGPYYDIKVVTAEVLSREPWESGCSLLVLPGGRDMPFVEDLHGLACMRIRQWIFSGVGKFLGICAGAYFASRKVEFEKDTKLEVVGERELALFWGVARGALFDGFEYGSDKGAHPSLIKFTEDVLIGGGMVKMYYNGGCWFDLADPAADNDGQLEFKTLGTYSERNDKPAIISGFLSKNDACSVILSGVHLEYDAEELNKSKDNTLTKELLASEKDRGIAWNRIISLLGLRVVEERCDESSSIKVTPLFFLFQEPNDAVRSFPKRLACESTTFVTSDQIPSGDCAGVKGEEHLLIVTTKLSQIEEAQLGWSFSPSKYFGLLCGENPSLFIGKHLLYAEYINSTQTLLTLYILEHHRS